MAASNASYIGNLSPFDEKTQTFNSWLELFEEYCSLNNVPAEPASGSDETRNIRRSLFLTHIGSQHYNVLHKACLPKKPNSKTIQELSEILKGKYDPPGSETTNRYIFHRRMQKESESIADYTAALQELSSRCNFGTYEDQACTYQLICGVQSEHTRTKLLSVINPKYADVKSIAMQDEAIQQQLREMKESVSQVNKVSQNFKNQSRQNYNSQLVNQRRPSQYGQIQSRQSQESYPSRNMSQSQGVQSRPVYSQNSPVKDVSHGHSQYQSTECYRCGRLHNANTCPARNWTCYNCQRIGHTSRKCRSQRVNEMRFQNEENNSVLNVQNENIDCVVDQLFESNSINNINCVKSQCMSKSYNVNTITLKYNSCSCECTCISCDIPCDSKCKFCGNISVNVNTVTHQRQLLDVNVEKVKLQMEIDTGAAVSLIPYHYYEKYFCQHEIQSSQVKLNSVSGPIPISGEIYVNVPIQNDMKKLSLIVCANKSQTFIPLLGRDWLDELYPSWRNIFSQQPMHSSHSVNANQMSKGNINSRYVSNIVEKLKNNYPNVFTKASSCIKGFEAKLCLKEGYLPVFQKPYQLPYGIVDIVSESLDKMEKEGKIYKVAHSEWASPLVPIKKPDGSYRLCVDFKKTVNPNLNIDSYPLPKAEDVFAKLTNGKVFVVLDLSDAYTQLATSKESQPLLTVNTHKGLYRYNRLIYGIASAPAIFQKIMDQILSGIENTCCYIDDILIKGNSIDDCYGTVIKVLNKLNEHNVRVNFNKCRWFSSSVEYLGHVISAEGRKPSPSLVEAIVNAKIPENVKEVRSYLGLLNYYNNYIENLSTLVKPLRELTENNCKWSWSQEHQKIFDLSKQKLVSSNVLMHFDPSLPIVLYSDASPVGLGAVLCHVIKEGRQSIERPIAFASCSLTKVQQNYSQLDREALGIVYAVTKFHKYLWGRPFTLITDNAPIKHILHPNKSIPTLAAQRLQHWALILENYHYRLEHKKAESLCHADALSRLPINKIIVNVNGNNVLNDVPISYVDIANETLQDPVLMKVHEYTRNGWPNHMSPCALSPYFKIRHNISIVDNCLLFGSRLIVPQKYQAEVLKLLHESHPGIVRTKMLARSLFWWPSMSEDIELKCQSCERCAIVNFKPSNVKMPWPQTNQPFERVHIDFFEFRKQHFLIYCDAYSKWLDIRLMSQCNANSVIKELYSIFAIVGLPCEVVSDNGPPFDSYQFIAFCTKLNIKVTKSPPYHPESNGLAERNVQIAKKALKKVIDKYDSSQDIALELSKFLLNYRNIQTTVNCKSPNSMLMSYMPRTMLSMLNPVHSPKSVKHVPTYPHFLQNDVVLARIGTTIPVRGTVVKVLSATQYLINVNGVLKKAHLNQLSHSFVSQPMASSSSFIPEKTTVPPTILSPQVQNSDSAKESQPLAEQSEIEPVLSPSQPPAASPPTVRRSSRIIRPPIKLNL